MRSGSLSLTPMPPMSLYGGISLGKSLQVTLHASDSFGILKHVWGARVIMKDVKSESRGGNMGIRLRLLRQAVVSPVGHQQHVSKALFIICVPRVLTYATIIWCHWVYGRHPYESLHLLLVTSNQLRLAPPPCFQLELYVSLHT